MCLDKIVCFRSDRRIMVSSNRFTSFVILQLVKCFSCANITDCQNKNWYFHTVLHISELLQSICLLFVTLVPRIKAQNTVYLLTVSIWDFSNRMMKFNPSQILIFNALFIEIIKKWNSNFLNSISISWPSFEELQLNHPLDRKWNSLKKKVLRMISYYFYDQIFLLVLVSVQMLSHNY